MWMAVVVVVTDGFIQLEKVRLVKCERRDGKRRMYHVVNPVCFQSAFTTEVTIQIEIRLYTPERELQFHFCDPYRTREKL